MLWKCELQNGFCLVVLVGIWLLVWVSGEVLVT